MRVTSVTVRSAMVVSKPYASFSNLQTSVTLTAEVAESEGFVVVADKLQDIADKLLLVHRDKMLAAAKAERDANDRKAEEEWRLRCLLDNNIEDFDDEDDGDMDDEDCDDEEF